MIMKRETTPDKKNFNILFISAFFGRDGCVPVLFFALVLLFPFYFWCLLFHESLDLSCVCGFFFNISLIILSYKLPNFFSVNSDYIYLIPSITKPEKPSGTVTRISLTSRYACRENTTLSTFNLRI